MKCRWCGMETEDETVCVWCKRDISQTAANSAAQQSPAAAKQVNWDKIGLIALVSVVVLYMLVECAVGKPGEGMARAAAKAEVRRRLIAPDTARFDNVEAFLISETDNEWVVRGEVTAQNRFGVPLRHEFRVVVQLIDWDRYKVIECKVYPP